MLIMNVKNTVPTYDDAKQRDYLIQRQYVMMQKIIFQRTEAQKQEKKVKG